MSDSNKSPFDSDEETDQNKKVTYKDHDEVAKKVPEAQQMVIKPHCECSKCDYWVKSADWCPPDQQKFEYNAKKPSRERKKQPLLKPKEHPQKKYKILWYNPKHLTKIEKQTVSKILVHGETIPEPVKMVTETYFTRDMQLSLQALNYKYSLPMQSFIWPAIFRQMNILMVGGAKIGKTLAYLPAICTFCISDEEKYKELKKYKGPLAVIICSNSSQCEEVYSLIEKINEKVQHKPKVFIATYPISHIPPTDILITIMDSLIHCFKTKELNFKRLCHLVLEDASSLLKNHNTSLYEVLEVVDEMLEHRLSTAKVQLIVASQKWTSDLKTMLNSMYIPPLVCVGNPLEAALYGNINLETKFLPKSEKMNYLEGVLRNQYKLYKTLIICDPSEITELNKFLLQKNIKTIALTGDLTKEEIDEYEIEWNFMQGGDNKVLLCSDFIFDTLLFINDAMYLINYSFPATWTGFMRRFSALSSHYKSPLESFENEVRCKNLILIDETCTKETPKILKLLSRLVKTLPPDFQKHADEFRQKTEHGKVDAGVELCYNVKLFGKCSILMCEKRHIVTEKDVSDDLPKCGRVVFRILNLKNVTECSVQLIDHINLQGDVSKLGEDDLKKPLIYEDETKIRAKDVAVGKCYAHCEYTQQGEEYTFCHVLKVDKQFVEVKLINGFTMQTLKSKLFEIPRRMKIVDVYFCNLIPPFKDEMFSGRSFYTTSTSLENLNYKKMILTGTIFLQLDNTLWLDNVVQMFNVEGNEVTKFNLTKHLIKLEVVEPCKSQIQSLHKLCASCEVSLPSYVVTVAKRTVITKEVEPQTAFLNDNIHEVILSSAVDPNELYVRLAKFQPLLESLEKDIQASIRNEISPKNINIEIGKYFLALDPTSQSYSRVKIINANAGKALCFYVDYGDEALVDISSLKILPTKFLTRLPFQAIQCRLYGLCPAFDEWDDEATDVLYKYMFEPESDVFRELFVQVETADDGDLMRAKKKYSVLLKDGYGEKNVLINQLMVDCGFATTIFTHFDDFEIPRREIVESDSEEEEEVAEEEEEFDVHEFTEEDFDFEINDPREFMKTLGMENLAQLQSPRAPLPAIEANTTPPEAPQRIEIPTKEPNTFTPDVFWSQTDKTVKMKIKLIGVEKYKTNLMQNRIFTFSAKLDDKNYTLKFRLYKRVEMEKHCAYGQEVQIVFKKLEDGEWLQLTMMTKRLNYVHYEILDSQLEDPKRKFLQLDISDDESDGGDNPNEPMYHEISDMDSDFDQDAVPSSDDD